MSMNFSEELSKFERGSVEHKFFTKIFEQLDDNFIQKSVSQDVKEAHNILNKAMEGYFESYILAGAVSKSIQQSDLNKDLNSSHNEDKTTPSVNSFYINLLKKYLPASKTSAEFKPFGLTQVDVEHALEKQKKTKEEKAIFLQLVEENINKFCQKFITATGSISSKADWKDAFNNTVKDLEKKIAYLSLKESTLQSDKQLKEMVKIYYEELSKGISLLSRLLSLHEQKLEFESSVAECYLRRCHCIHLKLQVFELKLLEATYNKETIPALKKISSELDQKEEQLKAEENAKKHSLESYLKLGKDYECLVEEYIQLIKKIKQEQWAIDDLKNKNKPEVST